MEWIQWLRLFLLLNTKEVETCKTGKHKTLDYKYKIHIINPILKLLLLLLTLKPKVLKSEGNYHET